jgi:hypothetical protein
MIANTTNLRYTIKTKHERCMKKSNKIYLTKQNLQLKKNFFFARNKIPLLTFEF